ncbi:hypothetical protein QV01_06605 [Gallibacterium genomosp. 3]|uniref:Uncharacterized protein n=1 Tax=Gallibacterium genomosp. 3 TaxID=505345 RepID=A0A1A7NQI7_9PAST|nr:hypothetical protein [Gallibacterium genomosp. 3]OBW91786.1 hypothetical protein QV01_06605 [Gallibacterium genomosp. 3]
MSDFIWSYVVVPSAVTGLVLVVIFYLSGNNVVRGHVSGVFLILAVNITILGLALYLGAEFLKFISGFF